MSRGCPVIKFETPAGYSGLLSQPPEGERGIGRVDAGRMTWCKPGCPGPRQGLTRTMVFGNSRVVDSGTRHDPVA